MIARHASRLLAVAGFALFITACAPPHSLPAGPTPIPTLVPVVEAANALNPVQEVSFTIESYPARLPSTSLGEPLYQANCAACHGEDGAGLVAGARNFSDLDYMRGETPASFYSAVTDGRADMPAFRDRLTSDERWDVSFYVWRFSTTAEALALGQQVYDRDCAACHGEDGRGEVLGAADFTDLRLVDDFAPRDFYLAVTQGVGSMPAWQARLSQDERWAVIDYIRTFSYDAGVGQGGDSASDAAVESDTPACDPAAFSENPFAWDDADAAAAGQTVYEQSCAMCHGEDGTGGLSNIADLTTPETQGALVEAPGEAFCIVAEGDGSMPGWKDNLSEEQMWQVLTFLSSLGQ